MVNIKSKFYHAQATAISESSFALHIYITDMHYALLSCRYTSIGMQRVNPNLASLFESLIPPAIFIAVMAMQLRYFRPTSHRRRGTGLRERETSFSTLSLSTLVPAALRQAIQRFQGPEDEEGEEGEGDGSEEKEEEGEEEMMPKSDTGTGEVAA